MQALIVFDFETTGLNATKLNPTTGAMEPHHEAIQVAAVALELRTLKQIGAFAASMRPLRPELATQQALNVHGWSLDFLREQAHPGEVSKVFRSWVNQWRRPIACGYNLDFDMGFLAEWCPGIDWNNRRLDVMHLVMAHFFIPGLTKDTKLVTVSKHLDIPHNAHDALGDVMVTAEVLRIASKAMHAKKEEPEQEVVEEVKAPEQPEVALIPFD